MVRTYLDFLLEKIYYDIQLIVIGGIGLLMVIYGIIKLNLFAIIIGVLFILAALIQLEGRKEYFIPYKDLIKFKMFAGFSSYADEYR